MNKDLPYPLGPSELEVVQSLRSNGALSRTEIADASGFSRSRVSILVDQLMEKNILVEDPDGVSRSGRRSRMLDFNPALCYLVGIDLGATSVDVAIANLRAKVLQRSSHPADVREDPHLLLNKIIDYVAVLLEQEGIFPEEVGAVGMGVPGPVEFALGTLVAPPLMPTWERYPIPDFFHEHYKNAIVVVDNDVNIMALGEKRVGIARGAANFIFVKIGTGIGSGIVVEGDIYRGSSGCAGDIGHICMDRDGPVCHCGNRGCLEIMAAGPPIAQRAMKAAERAKDGKLRELLEAGDGRLTARHVGQAVAAGDRSAIEIVQDSGRMIGETLAGLVNFFNPELILIGGGVAKIGHHLLASIRQSILLRSAPLSTKDLRVEYSSLGDNAGIKGAIHLALDEVFVVQR